MALSWVDAFGLSTSWHGVNAVLSLLASTGCVLSWADDCLTLAQATIVEPQIIGFLVKVVALAWYVAIQHFFRLPCGKTGTILTLLPHGEFARGRLTQF